MFRTLCTTALALGCGISTLFAQASTIQVTAGRLVRLHLADGSTVTAAYLDADADSVMLLRGGADTLRVARAAIMGTEAFIGKSRSLGAGGLLGGVAGMLLGVAIGAGSCEDDGWGVASECRATTMLGGAAVGALLGLGISAAMPSERWDSAALPEVKVLSAGSGGKGVAVGLRLRF